MKPLPLALLTTLAATVLVHSQNDTVIDSSGSSTAPTAVHTFIPHSLEVTPFSPPPPPVLKRLPVVRVDAAVTYVSKNGRTMTIQRGEASTAPDLPPSPPPPPYVESHEPTPEEVAQRIWQHRHNINLGATVLDHEISVVNWTDQETLVHYEAVCGFDIGLLAGIGGFVHNGQDYCLFLMHSDYDTTWERRVASQWYLEIPDVAPGEILFTRGDVSDRAATAAMTVIKEIIAVETPRLLPYQAARIKYQAASAAWHAAHPPIPRDETFILRPHRAAAATSSNPLLRRESGDENPIAVHRTGLDRHRHTQGRITRDGPAT